MSGVPKGAPFAPVREFGRMGPIGLEDGGMKMYDSYGRRAASTFGAFLLGGIVGAILGLLFAPRSGKETRDMLAEKGREYWGEGVELYEKGAAKAGEVYEAGKQRAGEIGGDVREKIDAARERLQETVAEASEGAKPAVKKVAEGAKGVVDVAEGKAQDALEFVAEKSKPKKEGTPTGEPLPEA